MSEICLVFWSKLNIFKILHKNCSLDFFNTVPDDKHQKLCKSDCFEFLQKLLLCPKLGKTGHF